MLATTATTVAVLGNYRGTDDEEGGHRHREVRFDSRAELRVRQPGLTAGGSVG